MGDPVSYYFLGQSGYITLAERNGLNTLSPLINCYSLDGLLAQCQWPLTSHCILIDEEELTDDVYDLFESNPNMLLLDFLPNDIKTPQLITLRQHCDNKRTRLSLPLRLVDLTPAKRQIAYQWLSALLLSRFDCSGIDMDWLSLTALNQYSDHKITIDYVCLNNDSTHYLADAIANNQASNASKAMEKKVIARSMFIHESTFEQQQQRLKPMIHTLQLSGSLAIQYFAENTLCSKRNTAFQLNRHEGFWLASFIKP